MAAGPIAERNQGERGARGVVALHRPLITVCGVNVGVNVFLKGVRRYKAPPTRAPPGPRGIY